MSQANGIINVTEAIDRAPLSARQITAFVLCGLVAYLDGYDIGSIGSMAPLIAGSLHLDVRGFGTIFSAGFVGMMLGALVIGPVADRIGRKAMIVVSTAIFGVFTLMIMDADFFNTLLTYRFLAGLGLGGALPNVIALTAEYAPQRARSSIVTAMSCGLPAGGFTAPLLGAYIVQHSVWQTTFIIGGSVPLVLCVILLFALPELARFLVASGAPAPRIAALLRRVLPGDREIAAATAPQFVLREATGRAASSVANLFTQGRTAMTLLLWLGFFMTLLTALFVVSWLPTVLREGGLPLSQGLVIASMFSLGGVLGTALLGHFMDRWGSYPVLVVGYFITAILIGSFGYAGSSLLLLGTTTFVAGFFIFGSQGGLQALSASLYPTTIRSAGVGWAFGFGRIGSIVGPAIGGTMLSTGWALPHIFMAAAVPAVIALFSIVLLSRAAPEAAAQDEHEAQLLSGGFKARS